MPPLPAPDDVLDTGSEGCGDLIMRLSRRFRALQPGQVIEVISADPGAVEDIPAWCRLQGHQLLHHEAADGRTRFLIRRGGA